jgi:hypothetical protein
MSDGCGRVHRGRANPVDELIARRPRALHALEEVQPKPNAAFRARPLAPAGQELRVPRRACGSGARGSRRVISPTHALQIADELHRRPKWSRARLASTCTDSRSCRPAELKASAAEGRPIPSSRRGQFRDAVANLTARGDRAPDPDRYGDAWLPARGTRPLVRGANYAGSRADREARTARSSCDAKGDPFAPLRCAATVAASRQYS